MSRRSLHRFVAIVAREFPERTTTEVLDFTEALMGSARAMSRIAERMDHGVATHAERVRAVRVLASAMRAAQVFRAELFEGRDLYREPLILVVPSGLTDDEGGRGVAVPF